ncbi:MAG: hypothetical protein DMF53_24605 [Acidobacteria bacterium]|nr:MAG: hypothetical protein DMF53_24605 [Acidobacteriota bacterium]
MTTQIRNLLWLQEIDSLLQDLDDAAMRKKEKALGFTLGSTARLQAERGRIAQGLSPEALKRYEQVRRRHTRAVVPVRQGVCMGCFTIRPTMNANQHQSLDTCERCSRILFRPARRG